MKEDFNCKLIKSAEEIVALKKQGVLNGIAVHENISESIKEDNGRITITLEP